MGTNIETKYFLDINAGDLKRANGGIKPDDWVAGIRQLLTQLEANKVGFILLDEIRSYRRWARIQPHFWIGEGYDPDSCNASAHPLPSGTLMGDGRVVRSLVKISPERHATGTPCAVKRAKDGGAVAEGHEIFFHELVHVLRHVSEKWGVEPKGFKRADARLPGGLKDYTNIEEFIAVVVTNIYASYNGKTVLRAGHQGHHQLDANLSDSFKFFQISALAFPLIEYMYKTDQSFFLRISNIKAKFNPLKAFLDDNKKARALSESDDALYRDAKGDAQLMLKDSMRALKKAQQPFQQVYKWLNPRHP